MLGDTLIRLSSLSISRLGERIISESVPWIEEVNNAVKGYMDVQSSCN